MSENQKIFNDREAHYNAGLECGIRFACDRFLGQLPCDVYEAVIEKTVSYLVEQYRNDEI